MAGLLEKIFGTHSSHELKKIYPIADKVMALEDEYRKLSDEQLRAGGVTPGLIRFSVGLESIDDILADVAQALEKV